MSLSRRISIWVLGVVVFILWSLAMMSAWSGTPVFVIAGSVKDSEDHLQDGWEVSIENTTRNWKENAKTGSDGPGLFSVVKLDFSTNLAAEVGDIIKVVAVSPDGKTTLEVTKTLRDEDVSGAFLAVDLVIQKKTSPPEDLNGDQVIDISDLVFVARDFGRSGEELASDVNKDGKVDITDLVLIARRFGERLATAGPSWVRAASVEVETEAVVAFRGDDLLVRLTAPGNEKGIAGYSLEVSYDPSRLVLLDVEEGVYLRRVGDTFWWSVPISEGKWRIFGVLLGERLADEKGEVARLRFRFRGDHEGALSTFRLIGGAFATADGTQWGVRARPTTLQLHLSSEARTLVGANYPNPFNPETWIPYQLAEESPVTLRIYDASGKLVRHLDLGVRSAGGYVTRDRAAYWDGRNELGETVASGIYYYQFRAGEYVKTQRMLLLK